MTRNQLSQNCAVDLCRKICISLSAYDPNERSRPADVGESISCAWRRISAAARRGSIGGAGACSLAALVSRLTFPLTHCNPDGKPTEKEPKAQKRMVRRIDERNGGEPHGHPDCDGHPTSPVHRPPTPQNRPRSEPVARPIVLGTSC